MHASVIKNWTRLFPRDRYNSPFQMDVTPEIVRSSYGSPAKGFSDSENHLVKGLIGDQVLILWDYGDDTPKEILEHLDLERKDLGTIEAMALVWKGKDISVCAVRVIPDTLGGDVEFIYLGKLVNSADGSPITQKAPVLRLIHSKRPWRWDVHSSDWMDFVTHEIGWQDLRQAVTVRFAIGKLVCESRQHGDGLDAISELMPSV